MTAGDAGHNVGSGMLLAEVSDRPVLVLSMGVPVPCGDGG
ncbi:hypothetical protein ACVLV4_002466 [Rathayibacter agropyri]